MKRPSKMSKVEILLCPRCGGREHEIDFVGGMQRYQPWQRCKWHKDELHFQCQGCRWPFWEHDGIWLPADEAAIVEAAEG